MIQSGTIVVESDKSALIDDSAGLAEFITISFDQDVILNSISLVVFSSGEVATLNVAGFNIILSDTEPGKDIFDALPMSVLVTGQSVALTWVSGNGFSFSEFTVSTVSELPLSLLLGLSSLVLFTRRIR